MATVEQLYEHLEKTIRGYNISADLGQIRAAFEYARSTTATSCGGMGPPISPIPFRWPRSWRRCADSESIMAALLHDCIEDTDAPTRILPSASAPPLPILWTASPS